MNMIKVAKVMVFPGTPGLICSQHDFVKTFAATDINR